LPGRRRSCCSRSRALPRPLLAPDPYANRPSARGSPRRTPATRSAQDSLGRDVLARVLHGARPSRFAVGVSVVVLSLLVGATVGAAAGYLGGPFDEAVAAP